MFKDDGGIYLVRKKKVNVVGGTGTVAGENVVFSRSKATGDVARRGIGRHLCKVDWG